MAGPAGFPAKPWPLLRNIEEPDVPKRLLEPLRTMLWEPQTILPCNGYRRSPTASSTRHCPPSRREQLGKIKSLVVAEVRGDRYHHITG